MSYIKDIIPLVTELATGLIGVKANPEIFELGVQLILSFMSEIVRLTTLSHANL